VHPLSNEQFAPAIVLNAGERRRLELLALTGAGHGADAADHLLWELDRARVVPAAPPDDVARMDSHLVYETGDGRRHVATLVYPDDARLTRGGVSVLSPHGTALIGLRAGQTISWLGRDGLETLHLLGVRQRP